MGPLIECVLRGWRFGLRLGNVLASLILLAFVLTLLAMSDSGGDHHYARITGGFALALVLFLVAGIVPGVALGLILGTAPQGLTRHWAPRTLLTLVGAGAVFFGEICVALAIWQSGVPVVAFLPTSLVLALIVSAFSGDIAGHTSRHPWIWGGRHPLMYFLGVPLGGRRRRMPF